MEAFLSLSGMVGVQTLLILLLCRVQAGASHGFTICPAAYDCPTRLVEPRFDASNGRIWRKLRLALALQPHILPQDLRDGGLGEQQRPVVR